MKNRLLRDSEYRKKFYEESMDKYYSKKKRCPNCKGMAHKTKDHRFTFDYQRPDSYKDYNNCKCLECGNKHIIDDRLPDE